MEATKLRVVVALGVIVVVVIAALSNPTWRQVLRSMLERHGLIATYQDGPVYRRRVAAHRTANATLPEECVLLVGDSLVESFSASLAAPRGWVNRGMSGDRVRHVDARLAPSVFGAPCSNVAVLVGINDLQHEGRDPLEVGRDIEALAARIHAEGRQVFLHTLPPPEPPHDSLVDPVRRLNQHLRNSPRVREVAILVDLEQTLAPVPRRTRDGIHLTASAYAAWAEALDEALDPH